MITELEKQVSLLKSVTENMPMLLKHKREKPSSVVEEQFIKDSVAKIFHQVDLQIQEVDIPKIICNDLKIQSRVLEAIQDDETGTLGDWNTVGSNYERKSNENAGQTDETSQKLNKNKEERQEFKEMAQLVKPTDQEVHKRVKWRKQALGDKKETQPYQTMRESLEIIDNKQIRNPVTMQAALWYLVLKTDAYRDYDNLF